MPIKLTDEQAAALGVENIEQLQGLIAGLKEQAKPTAQPVTAPQPSTQVQPSFDVSEVVRQVSAEVTSNLRKDLLRQKLEAPSALSNSGPPSAPPPENDQPKDFIGALNHVKKTQGLKGADAIRATVKSFSDLHRKWVESGAGSIS